VSGRECLERGLARLVHRKQLVDRGDLEDSADAGVARDERHVATGRLRRSCPGNEHAHSRGVQERAFGQVDDDPVTGIRSFQRFRQAGARRHVEVALDLYDDSPVGQRLNRHLGFARPCHQSESR